MWRQQLPPRSSFSDQPLRLIRIVLRLEFLDSDARPVLREYNVLLLHLANTAVG